MYFDLHANFSENLYWVSKASLRNWRRLALQKVEVVNKKEGNEQPGKFSVSEEGAIKTGTGAVFYLRLFVAKLAHH